MQFNLVLCVLSLCSFWFSIKFRESSFFLKLSPTTTLEIFFMLLLLSFLFCFNIQTLQSVTRVPPCVCWNFVLDLYLSICLLHDWRLPQMILIKKIMKGVCVVWLLAYMLHLNEEYIYLKLVLASAANDKYSC